MKGPVRERGRSPGVRRGAMRLLAAVGCGVTLGTAGSAPLPQLRVCLLEDNLPLSSGATQQGLDVETGRKVAEALKRPFLPVWSKNQTRIIEVDESDFPLHRLSGGDCDAIFSVPGAAAVEDTPGVTVGAPYYGAGFELVGREGAVPTRLKALGNEALAVQSQTIAAFVLQADAQPVQTYFSTEKALQAVSASEVNAAFVWGPSAGWYIQTHPAERLALSTAGAPRVVARWNEHVATRNTDAELRTDIDRTLARLRTSGELQAIFKRYGVPFHEPFDVTYSAEALQQLLR